MHCRVKALHLLTQHQHTIHTMPHLENPKPIEGFKRSIAKYRDTRSLIQGWLRSDNTSTRLSMIDTLPAGFKSRVFNMFSNARTLFVKAEEAIDKRDRIINLVKRDAFFVLYEDQLIEEAKQAEHFRVQSQVSQVRIVFDLSEMRPVAILREPNEHQLHIWFWQKSESVDVQISQMMDTINLAFEATGTHLKFILRKRNQDV